MFSSTSIPIVRYRLDVLSRCVAAVMGGYALSAVFAASLGLALAHSGTARADAVLSATMAAFLVHAIAALLAFGCATAWRAWLGIGLPTVALGALALAMGWNPGWNAA